MFLSVYFRYFVDVLDDVFHETLGSYLSALFILGDHRSHFLSGSLGSHGFGSLLSVGFVGGSSLLLSNGFGGVQLLHQLLVLQGVLLLDVMGDNILLGGSHHRLDFVRVNDSSEITSGHARSVQLVALLLEGILVLVSEESV